LTVTTDDTNKPFTHGMGWRVDTPDYRDHLATLAEPVMLPDAIRLDALEWMPPVYDQERLGSCTANALAAAIEFDLRRQTLVDFMPSRLFIYYNERVLERSTEYDAGAEIRDGAKTLHRTGVCSETSWPYDVSAFNHLPPLTAYQEARRTKTANYGRVARHSMRHILAAGSPFTIGFTVYDSFRSIDDTGIMPMPAGDVLGGHAVLVCGYDTLDDELYYRVRNSWGESWGDAGYFWMPATYLTSSKLSRDFWAIETVA
jgi:C1A family cysteine protease